MNASSKQVVAIAERREKTIRVKGKKHKTATVFFNGAVVFHHIKAKCLKRKPKGDIHRGMLMALLKAGVGLRCSDCWSERKWRHAARTPSPKAIPPRITPEARSNAEGSSHSSPSSVRQTERAPGRGMEPAAKGPSHESQPPRPGKTPPARPPRKRKQQPHPDQKGLLDWD